VKVSATHDSGKLLRPMHVIMDPCSMMAGKHTPAFSEACTWSFAKELTGRMNRHGDRDRRYP
jgi:hypothetical protein